MYKGPALLLILLLSLYTCALRAQTTNGSITGRVTDPSKATIPDAKVAAVNAGTNFRYESTTNGAGEYTLANLPPGTYRIEVEKSGFKKLVRPDVTLHVQDALAIDFEMAVGSLSDTVTVEAGAPLVNTTSATVSTVVDQTFVENIPLNGRSFQTCRRASHSERVSERTRIARDLHDTLLQSFHGILLHFQTGINQLPEHPAEARTAEARDGRRYRDCALR